MIAWLLVGFGLGLITAAIISSITRAPMARHWHVTGKISQWTYKPRFKNGEIDSIHISEN